MKLGFDIDGITANMAKKLVEVMNEKYGLDYDETVFKDHAIHNNKYVDDPELNEEIATYIRNEVIENPEAIPTIETHKEAVLALRKLAKSGHTIHHITARPANQKVVTVDWLRDNNIPFDTVHVIGKGGPNRMKVSKGRLGRTLNLDFYMDDCSWHLDDMYRYKNRWRKGLGLFTRPWNEGEPLSYNTLRFDDWKSVIRHLGIQKR
jgi:uncharacterized HAD superfamily protein